MRLDSLIRPLEKMTDEELLERLRNVRHNREVIRPASQKHIEKAEKKAGAKVAGNIQKLLEGMNEEEREALMKQLEGGQQ